MSFLKFEEHPKPPERKTRIWTVVNTSEIILGKVKWWPAWRKYTFLPATDSVFDITCLREIADFLHTEQRKHMAALAVNKE